MRSTKVALYVHRILPTDDHVKQSFPVGPSQSEIQKLENHPTTMRKQGICSEHYVRLHSNVHKLIGKTSFLVPKEVFTGIASGFTRTELSAGTNDV